MDIKINHPDILRLFTIETYIDPEAGEILRIVPNDPAKDIKWRGSTTLQGLGPQPITIGFDIPGASSLETAVNLWPKEAEKAIKDTLEQMRTQAIRSAILTPGGKSQ